MAFRLPWRVLAWGGAGAAVIAAGLTAWHYDVVDIAVLFSAASVEQVEAAIASWGAAAPIASVGLMVLHSFLPFPAELLAVANGMLFGFGFGLLVTWAGAMLGALLAFALARSLGQPFVRRRLGERRWAQLEAWTSGAGIEALILARLTPVISFNLVNYAAGLAGVRWWRFTWTTAVGILPITIASVLVGSHMAVIPWQIWGAAVLAIAGLMLLYRWRRRRW
jgi:uncharacterized membrane protein YdjX (TVP38/TMEM64 family)